MTVFKNGVLLRNNTKIVVNLVNFAIIKIWSPEVKNCRQRGKVWQ